MSALHSAEMHYVDHPDLVHRTPWWTISVVFHVVVVLFAMMILVTEAVPPGGEDIVIMVPQELIPQAPELVNHTKTVATSVKTVATEIDYDDEFDYTDELDILDEISVNETDINQKPEGFEDNLSEIDLKGKGTDGTMGLGSGLPSGMKGRQGPGKHILLARRGGTPGVPIAVLGALTWFKRHQSADGSWSFDSYHKECKEIPACSHRDLEKTYPDWDSCATGLALLCFLGDGHTHKAGEFRGVVFSGLSYLLDNQKEDGSFSPNNYVHAISTMALVEAFGMTEDPVLRKPSEKAVAIILSRQNDGGYLGWDYGKPSNRNDTSVTGWQVMALKSAKMAGIDIGNAFEGAAGFLEKITPSLQGDEYNPEMDFCSYIYRADTGDTGHKNATLTAISLLCRIFMGQDPDSPLLKAHADKLLGYLPEPGRSDYYQWYYATLAMFQMGGDYWKKYNRAMLNTFLDSQCSGGCADGSWAAPENSSCHGTRKGGRLFATATACLSLEVYYRYERASRPAGAKR